MSIMNAQLAHLTRMVIEVREINGVSLQEVLLLDTISPLVANCRKLQIPDEEITEAINKGLERLKMAIAP